MTNRRFYRIINIAGIVLLLSAAAMLVYSAVRNERPEKASPAQLVEEMIPYDKIAVVHHEKFRNKDIEFFEVRSALGEIEGYIFNSGDFAPDIVGYNDKIIMLIYTDASGIHKDFKVLEEYETPEYFAKVMNSREIFLGKNLFTLHPEDELEMVTGATISSHAIARTLRKSGNLFRTHILKLESPSPSSVDDQIRNGKSSPHSPLIPILLFSVMLILAIAVRYRITPVLRYTFLVLTVILFGIIFNMQFSSDQIISLLTFRLPALFTAAFFLAVVMPVTVLIFGNFYCGYLCPAGALQELIAIIRPEKLTPKLPSKKLIMMLSTLKYLILFIMVIGVVVFHHVKLLNADMIRSAFSRVVDSYLYLIIIPAFALSLFYKRFWCRIFCPTGAFLSILNYAKFARKYLPLIKPGKCDLGVSSHKELDCINCDYCRFEKTPFIASENREKKLTKSDWFMVIATLYLLTVILYFSFWVFS